MTILNRLAALERRAKSGNEITIVKIEGGLLGELEVAEAGPHRWMQHAGESADVFKTRAADLTKAAGEKLLIIGGLPAE